MRRREFLKHCLYGAGALIGLGSLGCRQRTQGVAGGPPPTPAAGPGAGRSAVGAPAEGQAGALTGKVGSNRLVEAPPQGVHAAVATKKSPEELVKAAVEAFGGMAAIVQKGDVVVIKPNLAWARGPETGANTSPEVLKAVIKLAQEAGAREVLVVENPCVSPKVSFSMSGAQEVCEALGVKLVALETPAQYQQQTVAKGLSLKSEQIAQDILECDVYINLPCLKHHSATNLTGCLKNQMGAIQDPQRYHREKSETSGGSGLHQHIADLATALVPTLNIMDGTRALTTNGPQGPGAVKRTQTVIVSHDMVTADMLAAKLLGYTENNVPHIKMAADLGVGQLDLQALKIAEV